MGVKNREKVNMYIENYEELKRNRDIIKSIDKDFFFELVDCLIEGYKKLEGQIDRMASFIEVFELDEEVSKTYCPGTVEDCKHKEDVGTCKSCIKEYFMEEK